MLCCDDVDFFMHTVSNGEQFYYTPLDNIRHKLAIKLDTIKSGFGSLRNTASPTTFATGSTRR